jgi:hypothetical protein
LRERVERGEDADNIGCRRPGCQAATALAPRSLPVVSLEESQISGLKSRAATPALPDVQWEWDGRVSAWRCAAIHYPKLKVALERGTGGIVDEVTPPLAVRLAAAEPAAASVRAVSGTCGLASRRRPGARSHADRHREDRGGARGDAAGRGAAGDTDNDKRVRSEALRARHSALEPPDRYWRPS